MKIGINAFYLQSPEVGFGRYTINLVRALAKYDKYNFYVLFYPHKLDEEAIKVYLKLGNNFRLKQIGEDIYINSNYDRVTWERNFYKLDLFTKENLDLFFIPYNSKPVLDIPNNKNTKIINSFHDIIPLLPLMPSKIIKTPRIIGILAPNDVKRFRYELKVAKDLDVITTVSNASREDLIKVMGLKEGQKPNIVVAYNYVGDEFNIIEDREIVNNTLKKFNLGKKYLLYVGGVRNRKNVISVAKAYHKLNDRLKDKYELVIVGKVPEDTALYKFIKKKNLFDKVKLIGAIDDAELVNIYNGAYLFINLSLYEGFGLPLVEAMACGVPVIASNVSSHPEIVGDGGVLVPPLKIKHISNKIREILENDDLRNNLKEKALIRAKYFNDKKSVENLIDIFKNANKYF